MKKISLIILLILLFLFTSCELPGSNNNDNNKLDDNHDSSLDGIDLSKYEMPQTDFLKDGHTLSNFEKIAKVIIEEGTFVYQPVIDEIGYEIVLEGDKNGDFYSLFYSVNNIKIAHIYKEKLSGSYYSQTYQAIRYVKLFDDNSEDFSICYKLINSKDIAFYSIYTTKRNNFDLSNNDGVFDLFRINYRNIKLTEDDVRSSSVIACDEFFKIYNEIIGNTKNIELNSIGFNNY